MTDYGLTSLFYPKKIIHVYLMGIDVYSWLSTAVSNTYRSQRTQKISWRVRMLSESISSATHIEI